MKRRPGPRYGRAEAGRRAKAIAIWNAMLLEDAERRDVLAAIRADVRQLAFDFGPERGGLQRMLPLVERTPQPAESGCGGPAWGRPGSSLESHEDE